MDADGCEHMRFFVLQRCRSLLGFKSWARERPLLSFCVFSFRQPLLRTLPVAVATHGHCPPGKRHSLLRKSLYIQRVAGEALLKAALPATCPPEVSRGVTNTATKVLQAVTDTSVPGDTGPSVALERHSMRRTCRESWHFQMRG